jgi:hypothetical protein
MHCLVRQAKRSYISRFLDPSLPPQTLWKNLDSIGVRDNDFAQIDICPDRLNYFFTSFCNVRRPTVQRSTARSTGNFVPPTRSFAFSNVNSHDVFIAIHRIGSNAIGLDEVPLRFIKNFLPSILPVIIRIYLILPLNLDAFLLHGRSLRWFLLQKFLIHLSLGTLDQ